MTISCNFATETVGSTKIPNEFTFPDWLEVDEEWFKCEVEQLAKVYPEGVYHVNVLYSTYIKPYNVGGEWCVTVTRQAYALELSSIRSLYCGPGARVGTTVGKAPNMPVGDLSHGTKEE